jgi:phosphoglycolate phosphatase
MPHFPFALIGFDLDGTLVDSLADLGVALNHALALAGRAPVPTDQTRHLIGGGAKRMLERALDLTGGAQDLDVDALHGELIAFYAEHIAVHTRPYPGCLEALDALALRGVKLAVVTNKLESLARRLLEELGMTSRFAVILGGDSLGRNRAKPAPDLLHEMVVRAGLVSPTRAAFVGDTSFDTRAAAAAAMPCVLYTPGFTDLPPGEMGASVTIDRYDQLVPALERL